MVAAAYAAIAAPISTKKLAAVPPGSAIRAWRFSERLKSVDNSPLHLKIFPPRTRGESQD
jgi:hypothetical protein